MKRAGAFNTGNQRKLSWMERAALACDLLISAIKASKVATISDVGCGDQKLREILRRRGWPLVYKGFDLLPQSDDVQKLDLNVGAPPGRADAALALGVLEYVDDVGACLRQLAKHAPLLIVSHTLRDGDLFDDRAQRERGWKNHLYAAEFELLLVESHWRVLDARTTSDGRTRIWLAKLCDRGGPV